MPSWRHLKRLQSSLLPPRKPLAAKGGNEVIESQLIAENRISAASLKCDLRVSAATTRQSRRYW